MKNDGRRSAHSRRRGTGHSMRHGSSRRSGAGKNPGTRVIAARLLAKWQALSADKRPPLNSLIQEGAAVISPKVPARSARAAQGAGNEKNSEDRALLGEIVTGTVRWLRPLILISEGRMKKPSKVPPIVKAILVTAIYQLLFLDRIPAFAVVNEAVKAARSCRASWAAGMVNAVLRGIVRDMEGMGRDALIARISEGSISEAEAIAISLSYPTWMVKKWMEQFDTETARQICLAGNSRSPVSLRVNRLKISRNRAVEMLKDAGIKAEISKISPDGIILSGFRGSPAAIPGFEAGMFQVQDESAQLISLLMDCQPGQRILDACAGLGGKTTHIAEITENRAHIDAWDLSGARLGLLEENTRRLGLSSIHVLNQQEFDAIRHQGMPVYHRILVDAPCSGLGVIRRHIDIKWNRSPDDSARLSKTQSAILRESAPLLKQGGIMVYAVCTTAHEETVQVAQRFMEMHEAWQLLRADTIMPGLPGNFITEEGYLRILPETGGPDGFFAAVFRRKEP